MCEHELGLDLKEARFSIVGTNETNFLHWTQPTKKSHKT